MSKGRKRQMESVITRPRTLPLTLPPTRHDMRDIICFEVKKYILISEIIIKFLLRLKIGS